MQKISLITASYNRGHTIRDTIESINFQTYPEIEHVFIDGVSKDDSVAIMHDTARRAPVIVSEPDKGFYDAYNKGLGRATGEIIGFLNSDDFYPRPDVIERVMTLFAAHPEIDGLHADLVYVREEQPEKIVRHWKSRAFTPRSFAQGFIPAHPTVFLRREVYDRVGGFDTSFRLAADYEFLLRTFHTHKLSAMHVPEIWVRMRTGGATGGNVSSIKAQNDEIRRAQEMHGVHYPMTKFYVRKVIDRSMQHLRAPFTSVPMPKFAA